MVVALTARPRTEESYRATYVDGMRRALDALAATGTRRSGPCSSPRPPCTAVGDRPPLDDETTPPRPADGPGRMLLEAEELFHERLPGGTVLRLSGLYGGSSTRLLDMVREGRVTDPHRWTNRIHREDAADAVVHLLTRPGSPSGSTSGRTTSRRSWATSRRTSPSGSGRRPPPADPEQGHGKRLSNARLRATGWAPSRPSYREGYAGAR